MAEGALGERSTFHQSEKKGAKINRET
jgi:hypothetical protein